MAEKPNILIAVPAYRDTVRAGMMISAMQAARILALNGISFDTLSGDFGDIEDARNYMATFFLNNTKCSALLFWDDDVKVAPSALIKMMNVNKPFVGCAVPLRRGPHKFNVSGYHSNNTAEHIGAGLILVQRSVFEQLASRPEVKRRAKQGYDRQLIGFFDKIETEAGRLGEDFSFCERWRKLCGGTVHVIVDEEVEHLDRPSVLRGRFSDHLKVSQLQPTTE